MIYTLHNTNMSTIQNKYNLKIAEAVVFASERKINVHHDFHCSNDHYDIDTFSASELKESIGYEIYDIAVEKTDKSVDIYVTRLFLIETDEHGCDAG